MADSIFNSSSIQPLEKIALTFSGGGYRAAAYALGVLSYFNKIQFKGKPLLQNVKAISTVSGGTITGAFYAVNARGNFQQFYDSLYTFLKEDKVMDHAMKKLEDNNHWKTNHKKQSLINAFAESYYDLLTKETIETLFNTPSHLEDIIFNATEFNNANVFRFQTTGMFGNRFTNCKELNEVKGTIRIADAIAASSCFPMGFEPIVFPDDFMTHNSPDYISLKEKPQFKIGLGLMDGGIVDNQGVDSIVQADARRENKKEQFDFLMISDVGGPLMDHWPPELDKEITGWRKNTISQLIKSFSGLGKWTWVSWVILLLGIVLTVIAVQFDLGSILLGIGCFISGFGSLLVLLSLAAKRLLLWTSNSISSFITRLPVFVSSRLKHFDDLALGLLQRMLTERITSAVSMVSEVFMKQVRRFTYYQVYENDDWKYRRASNLIYELTADHFPEKKEKEQRLFQLADPELDNPGEKIFQAAGIAASTPTTLWFTDDDKKINRLNHLIACGQFTTCFNLLYYLGEIKNDPESPLKHFFVPNQELDTLYNVLLEDWKAFKNNPLHMVSRNSV